MARISEAVYAAGLVDQLPRPIGQLSKGYRQRVGLAQAILHRPPLLILDEPTIGLDPTQIVAVRRLIRRLAERSTVLFSTHILSEVELLCDRVVILMNGEVKADARLRDLAVTSNAVLVLAERPPDFERAVRGLGVVQGLEPIESSDGYPAYRVLGRPDGGTELCPKLYDLARERGWPVRELRRDTRTLETVFNELALTA